MWVETVINSVRFLNRPVQKEYRCDLPNKKRYMQMVINPQGNETLHVRHNLLRTEQLLAAVTFGSTGPDTQSLNQRCNICNRLNIDGNRQEFDEALSLNRIDTAEPVAVYCTVCDDRVLELSNLAVLYCAVARPLKARLLPDYLATGQRFGKGSFKILRGNPAKPLF
jgi:hypothetical protein